MRRLLWVTCLLGAVGCQCGKPEGALKVVVKVDPAQRATCVVLEISAGGSMLASTELVREGRDELVVGLKRGELPQEVTLKAKAHLSANGCDGPRSFNGESADVAGTFPESGVTTLEVALPPPAANLDVDRDGFTAVANGGTDCNDNDSSIRPGAVQLCTSSIDQDCDGSAGCTDTDCSSTAACQRAPDRLVFVTGPVTLDARACSPALSVEAQDSAGATVAQQGLPVSLSANPSAGVTFYSDAACANAVTTVTILQGETRASFFFRATNGGTTFTATASVLGLTPATQLETVNNPAPTQLAFTNPPRTQPANTCGLATTVELRDSTGAATQTNAPVLVTVGGAPATGLQFFSDPACVNQLSGSAFSIPTGMSSGTFYARGTRAGAITLTASGTGLTNATQVLTVTPLVATQLRFVSSAQGIATATCSAPVTVETQDVYGNASPVAAQLAVALSAVPPTGFTFYSDAGCANAVVTLNVAAAASQAVFYFRGTSAGTVVMTAASALGNDTQSAGIGVGPPVKLTITSAVQSAVVAGICSGAVTVQSRDVSDNPSNITGSNLAVVLTPNPLTPIQFFSDPSCATLITGTSIAVGNTTATFYFSSTRAGTVNIAVSSSLATGDNQTETVVPTTPSVLRFTNTAITTTSTTCAGPFTLESRDQYANPSPVFSNTNVTLTPVPGGVTFFALAGCTGGSTVTIAAASSTTSFFASAPLANTYQLTAAAGGLGNDQQNFVVDPGPVNRLVMSPPTSSQAAGTCSAAIGVQRQDAQTNPVTAGGQITVALTEDTASANFTFHLAAGCGDAPVTSVDIPNNGSSATIYVRGTLAETVNLTASSAGITNNGTHAVTIDPDVLNRLVFNPTAGAVTAGVCTPDVTVQRRDSFGNPVTAGGALQVDLAHNASGGTFEFFQGSGCSGSAQAFVTINAGNSQTTLSMRATRSELVNVVGTGTGVVVNGTFALTVNPAAADRLIFAPLSGNLTAGQCLGPISLERRDPNMNLVTSGNLTVSLTENTSSLVFTFHATAGCGGAPVGTVDIVDTASSAAVYIRAELAEVVNVGATGTGITTPGAYTLTVDPANATQLVFTTTPITVGLSTCSGILTVQRRDQYGNGVPVVGNTGVTYADDGTAFEFHNASNCSDADQPGGTMLNGQSILSFYVRSPNGDPQVTMTITLGGTLIATQDAAVSGPPQLVFTTPARAITGGQCTAVMTVQRQDAASVPITSGVTTVNLSSNATSNATGGLTFHTDALCGTAGVTSVQIPDTVSTTDFYVRSNVAPESPTVTAQAAGHTPDATQAVTVTVGPAAKLAFTSPGPQTIPSLGCSAQVTVQLQDAGGNAVNAGGAGRTVTLAGSGGTNTTFHTTSNCTGGTTTLPMAAGVSIVQFYFRSQSLTTSTITASISGVPAATDANEVENFTPAAADHLVFATANTTVAAGLCHPVTIERQDALNRATAPASTTAVTLNAATPNPAAPLIDTLYFSDNACTVALVSPFNISASSNNTVVYVKGSSGSIPGANQTAAQAYAIVAASVLNPDPTYTLTVNPMVRRGSCTVSVLNVPCTITPALPDSLLNQTMLVYQASASDAVGQPQFDHVNCRLQANGGNLEVFCYRAADGSDILVNWQAVTTAYPAAQGGMTVQHLTVAQTLVASASMDIAVNAATRASSFALFSFNGIGVTTDGNETMTCEMTSDTNVRMSMPADGTHAVNGNVAQSFEVQVVNWSGASVARAVSNGGNGGTFAVSQATPNLGRSFLIHSSRMASIVNSAAPVICSRRLSGVITDATALSFQRACNGTSPADDMGNISWERVELPTSATVQRQSIMIPDNDNVTTSANFTAVDRTRAFAFVSGQGFGGLSGGRTNWTTTEDRLGCAQANVTFVDDNNINLTRNMSAGSCNNGGGPEGQGDFGVFLVEVTP